MKVVGPIPSTQRMTSIALVFRFCAVSHLELGVALHFSNQSLPGLAQSKRGYTSSLYGWYQT